MTGGAATGDGPAWTEAELGRFNDTDELLVSTARPDGTWRSGQPIWVVTVDDAVYVRTWHRRPNGWYGHAVEDRRARVRVDEHEADVAVEDIGTGSDSIRATIDTTYRRKYGTAGAASMVSDVAADTTLQLHRAGRGGPSGEAP